MNRRLLTLCLVLLATLGLRVWLTASAVVPARASLSGFPVLVGSWTKVNEEKLSAGVLAVLKPDDYLVRNYRDRSGAGVGLFIAYYAAQHAGESMHSPKNCLPGSGWAPLTSDTVVLDRDAAGNPIEVNRYLVQQGRDRAVVLYWYQEGGRVIASEYWGKFFLIWDAIRTGRRDGSLIRVVVAEKPGEPPNQSLQVAMDFARSARPLLPKFLPN